MPAFDGIFVGCLFAGASIIAFVVLVMVLMSQKTERGDIEKGETPPPASDVPKEMEDKHPGVPSRAAGPT